MKTYGVDQHGDKDGSGNLRAVFGIFDAADHLVVVAPEQQAHDGQDDDGEDGDDDAAGGAESQLARLPPAQFGCRRLFFLPVSLSLPSTYQDHACIAPTSGFMMKMVSETVGWAWYDGAW